MRDEDPVPAGVEQWLHELANVFNAIAMAAMVSSHQLGTQPGEVEDNLRDIAARCARGARLLASPPIDLERGRRDESEPAGGRDAPWDPRASASGSSGDGSVSPG